MIVGVIYLLIAILFTLIAWLITFTTGDYPKWAGKFVVKTFQYWNRVLGYAVILVTDEYPSFKL